MINKIVAVYHKAGSPSLKRHRESIHPQSLPSTLGAGAWATPGDNLRIMKLFFGSILGVLTLTQCHESPDSLSPAELLVGSWANIEGNAVIEFDRGDHYSIKFSPDMVFGCRYQISAKDHTVAIYDPNVTYECQYQFITENELKLTRINPPSLTEDDHTVSVYRRIP